MKTYDDLILNLENFIKKFYKVKIVRGLILSVIILLSFYLIFSVSEFYIRFTVTGRTVLFFSFLLVFAFVIYYYIIIPVFNLFKIGKRIDYKNASTIISKHFPDIKDKLLNILELKELKENEPNYNKLIDASISQKAKKIRIIPFKNAVKYNENKKYLKYLIPILLIFVSLLSISPTLLKESNKRIIFYNEEFIDPPPFSFILLNDSLNLKRGTDLKLKVKISGKYIPDEVFINYSGNNFLMKKEKNSKTEFTYIFKNLNNTFELFFSSQQIESKLYKVNVLPSPKILKFSVFVDVPSYTQENDTLYNNIGDIVVPYGSSLKWNFITTNVDSVSIISNSKKHITKREKESFSFTKKFYKDFKYTVSLANRHFVEHNLLNFNVSVIPDLFPSININEIRDTANYYIAYYRGLINDDYGFKSLQFKFRLVDDRVNVKDKSVEFQTIFLQFSKSDLKQEFYYSFDFSSLNITEGKKVQYFFEVGDNDGINGSKIARTKIMTFDIPSYSQRNEHNDLTNKNIQSKLDQSTKLSKEIKKDLELMRERNLSGNVSDWENKQMLNSILEKQKKLNSLTKDLARENLEKNKMDQNTEQNEDLLKKQEEIQNLLDEIMTDELKELMKELEKLQNQFNEEMMNKLLEEYEFSYDEMSDRLDRTKELLMREQIEQKIDNAINELEELSEEQKKLSDKTLKKESKSEQLSEQQKEIQEKFEEISKEYNDAREINKELQNKMKLDDFKEEKEQIESEFNKTKENLQNNKKKKASQSQDNNSKSMKKLAESMKSMMQANSMQQQSEDMDALRRILENLLTFSFKQEELSNDFKRTHHTNPKYIDLSDKQLAMKEDFAIINDSLKSLAGRISQISKTILDELYIINENLNRVQQSLDKRKIPQSRVMQNKIMTSSNNLALLLSAILDQMKNQKGGSGGSASKNSKKKKGKDDGFQDLKGQQESLKRQMEQMLKQLKEGKGQFDKNAQNKQLAKMLAQQEIFRQMLKEMQSKYSLNPETQKLLNKINKMAEENEKDIVNRKITPQLLERQKLIETRLLEAEKSENKRKTENKRESKEGENNFYKSAKDVFIKSKKNKSFSEDIYRKNIQLRNYYKKLYEEYSKTINQ